MTRSADGPSVRKSIAARFSAAALATGTYVVLAAAVARLDPAAPGAEDADPAPWSPGLFQALTFGHWASGIDWVWIRALQDQASGHVQPGSHASNYFRLKLVTDLDPAYWEIYAFGAIFLAVVRNDVEGARELLVKGEEFRTSELITYPEEFRNTHWEQSWAVPFNLAYVYLFELEDLPEASMYYRRAAGIEGAPSYLKSLAARLTTTDGQYEVGLRLLNFLIDGAGTPRLRATLEAKREALRRGRELHALNRAFREFAGASGAGQPGAIAPPARERLWRRFLAETGTSARDPWGGELSLDSSGRIVSSSHRTGSFGMEF